MTRKVIMGVGECMVELAQIDTNTYRRGFAGDTFNAAWYARHMLPDTWDVAYLSAVGSDPVSGEMRDFFTSQGIGTDALRILPSRTVGLYMISTDAGERSFSYWRDRSAARLLADDPDWLATHIAAADTLHFSGITLAILSPDHRSRLCAALAAARARGATVSFDTNLRTRLWEDTTAMRLGLTMGAEASSIILPSFDDETELFGDAKPEHTIARYREAGAEAVLVKNGASDLTGYSDASGVFSLTPEIVKPVDTTGAGDSFAGALLALLETGETLEDATRAAMKLAAQVIRKPGALVPEVFESVRQ